jgi:hypothetical protein
VKVPLYSEIKAQEAKSRRLVMKQLGSHIDEALFSL